jgi:methionine-gamma-lyase
MASVRYHKAKIGEHELKPETLMLGYGYDPSLSEGSVKPPVFLTSTFVFQTAEQGRDFFDYLAGRRPPPVAGQPGLVEIVEDRIAIHEKAESGLVFASGMAAIVTLMLAYVRPGETVLHSRPLYGGTEVLIDKTLAPLGVKSVGFTDGLDVQNIRSTAERARIDGRIAMIFIETPSKIR